MTGGAVLLAYGGVEATGGTVLAGSKVATTAVKALGGFDLDERWSKILKR